MCSGKLPSKGREHMADNAGISWAPGVKPTHLSPEDLAERLGVPLETVYGWNKTGRGPQYMRVGRHVRYRLADVIAWENSRTVASGRPLGAV
jgi:excisionase family DNA binding protein